MAQTIGTNIVMDEQDVGQFLNKILSALEFALRNRDKEKYSEMIKKLGAYVGEGGKLSYSVIDSKFTKEIEEYLQSKNINYMLMPSQNGMGIAVRDKDADKLQDILDSVMKYSIDNTSQLSNSKEFLDDIKYNPKTRSMDIPILSFSDNITRIIVQQHMLDSGIVPCFDNRNNKVYARPDAIFNERGDLVDAMYKSGMDLARMSLCDEYAITKSQQIVYDRDTLNEFISDAKNGKTSFLVDRNNTSKTMLSIDVTGDIILREGRKTKVLMTADEVSKFSKTDIYSHLSRYSDKIYNMTVCKNKTGLEAIMHPDGTKTKDENDAIIDANCSGKRPINTDAFAKALSEASNELDTVMNSILVQVNQEIANNPKYAKLSPEKLFNLKRNMIAEVIQLQTNDTLKDFLNKDIEGLTLKNKEDILKVTLEATDDFLGNSTNDVTLEFVKQKKLEETLAKGVGAEKENDKSPEQDL